MREVTQPASLIKSIMLIIGHADNDISIRTFEIRLCLLTNSKF